MEQPSQQMNEKQSEVGYFESYEVKENDLKTLQEGIDLLTHSDLVEDTILDDLRFVTYDSRYFYIFTKGQHATNGRFVVEEITTLSQIGYRIYKVEHSGSVGRKEKDYRGARAWLLSDEIETTAVNAKKFPNENVLYQPDLPQPKEILDVVSMAPVGPYSKIQQGRFNYLTDVIFHEVGHIEHRRLEGWQEGEAAIGVFPSEKQRESFLSIVRESKKIPEWVTKAIIENIDKRAISEMYPMLIDREAAKRFDTDRFDDENVSFEQMLIDIKDRSSNGTLVEKFIKSLKSGHIAGRLLVRILEERFPDFNERKRFVREVLTPVR